MRMFYAIVSILLATWLWNGYVYESDLPVGVLDGKFCEIIRECGPNGCKQTFRELKPIRKDDNSPIGPTYTEKKLVEAQGPR